MIRETCPLLTLSFIEPLAILLRKLPSAGPPRYSNTNTTPSANIADAMITLTKPT